VRFPPTTQPLGEAARRPVEARVVGGCEVLFEAWRDAAAVVWVGREVDGPRALVLVSTLIEAPPGEALARAATSARSLSGLSAAGLLATRRVSPDEGLAVVSEYVDGESLRSLLRLAARAEIPIPAPVALRIAADYLDGLAELLQQAGGRPEAVRSVCAGVGPDGVVLSAAGEVKLAFHGVAARIVAVPAWARSEDVLHHRAPEQLGTTPTSDARSAVFGVGALLWEMLAGKPPMWPGAEQTGRQGVSPIARLDAGGAGTQVSPAIADLVARALERAQAARFQSPAVMRKVMRGSLEDDLASRDQVAAWVDAVARRVLAGRRKALALLVDEPAAGGGRISEPPITPRLTAEALDVVMRAAGEPRAAREQSDASLLDFELLSDIASPPPGRPAAPAAAAPPAPRGAVARPAATRPSAPKPPPPKAAPAKPPPARPAVEQPDEAPLVAAQPDPPQAVAPQPAAPKPPAARPIGPKIAAAQRAGQRPAGGGTPAPGAARSSSPSAPALQVRSALSPAAEAPTPAVPLAAEISAVRARGEPLDPDESPDVDVELDEGRGLIFPDATTVTPHVPPHAAPLPHPAGVKTQRLATVPSELLFEAGLDAAARPPGPPPGAEQPPAAPSPEPPMAPAPAELTPPVATALPDSGGKPPVVDGELAPSEHAVPAAPGTAPSALPELSGPVFSPSPVLIVGLDEGDAGATPQPRRRWLFPVVIAVVAAAALLALGASRGGRQAAPEGGEAVASPAALPAEPPAGATSRPAASQAAQPTPSAEGGEGAEASPPGSPAVGGAGEAPVVGAPGPLAAPSASAPVRKWKKYIPDKI
jgi:hypothetical protein